MHCMPNEMMVLDNGLLCDSLIEKIYGNVIKQKGEEQAFCSGVVSIQPEHKVELEAVGGRRS